MFFGIDYSKGIMDVEIKNPELKKAINGLEDAINNKFQTRAADTAFQYLEGKKKSKDKTDSRIPAFLMGGLVGFIIGVVIMAMAFFN